MGGGMDMSQGMGCGMMGGNPMMGMMGGQGMPNPQMQQQTMAQKGAMMYPMMGNGANLMMLRKALLEAAKGVLKDKVTDVLIVDIVRQDS